jgi:hypothetical protein
MPHRINWSIYFAVVALVLFVWFQFGGTSADPNDRDIMLGTWTDEAGLPGNSIRFYLVARDLPGAPLATAFEGRATLVRHLGEENAEAGWNYGSWEPLVLNLWVGEKSRYVAIRKLDDDHILIRFGTDPEEMYRPEALDHPDTRRLTRVGREQS